eukprot:GHVO01040836.1.p1 GENE.GHVO01040836.1~~GHVO01040836.1.p1  ORF type:complete len:719 (+),score=185.63 GHVO01040836.1:262-2157(+)
MDLHTKEIVWESTSLEGTPPIIKNADDGDPPIRCHTYLPVETPVHPSPFPSRPHTVYVSDISADDLGPSIIMLVDGRPPLIYRLTTNMEHRIVSYTPFFPVNTDAVCVRFGSPGVLVSSAAYGGVWKSQLITAHRNIVRVHRCLDGMVHLTPMDNQMYMCIQDGRIRFKCLEPPVSYSHSNWDMKSSDTIFRYIRPPCFDWGTTNSSDTDNGIWDINGGAYISKLAMHKIDGKIILGCIVCRSTLPPQIGNWDTGPDTNPPSLDSIAASLEPTPPSLEPTPSSLEREMTSQTLVWLYPHDRYFTHPMDVNDRILCISPLYMNGVPFFGIGTGCVSGQNQGGGRVVVLPISGVFEHPSPLHAMSQEALKALRGVEEDPPGTPLAVPFNGPVHVMDTITVEGGSPLMLLSSAQRLYIQDSVMGSEITRSFVDSDETIVHVSVIKNYVCIADVVCGLAFLMVKRDGNHVSFVRLAKTDISAFARPLAVGEVVYDTSLGLVIADIDGRIRVFNFGGHNKQKERLHESASFYTGSTMHRLIPSPMSQSNPPVIGLLCIGTDAYMSQIVPINAARHTTLADIVNSYKAVVPLSSGGIVYAHWRGPIEKDSGIDARIFRDILFMADPIIEYLFTNCDA